MNPYQHALDTMQYALNDNGGLAWLKHNQAAILKALTICRDLENMKADGITEVKLFDDGENLPIPEHDIFVSIQDTNSVGSGKPADVFADVVPPIHEIQVDPVSPAFEMWHDAEERN